MPGQLGAHRSGQLPKHWVSRKITIKIIIPKFQSKLSEIILAGMVLGCYYNYSDK